MPPPPASPPSKSAPPPPPPDDASGEDAYARRLALSSSSSQPPSSTTISAAPILYRPPPPSSPSPPPPDAVRTARPGQAGFAHRLMAKYGWTSGAGLGASSSGIVNPLRVHVEKRRKKADADGGGWAEPAGKGKIIGGEGKNGKKEEQQGLSEVIVLLNMVDNMPNLAQEVEDGLGQEIGEECGEQVRFSLHSVVFVQTFFVITKKLTRNSMVAWRGSILTRRRSACLSSLRIKYRHSRQVTTARWALGRSS